MNVFGRYLRITYMGTKSKDHSTLLDVSFIVELATSFNKGSINIITMKWRWWITNPLSMLWPKYSMSPLLWCYISTTQHTEMGLCTLRLTASRNAIKPSQARERNLKSPDGRSELASVVCFRGSLSKVFTRRFRALYSSLLLWYQSVERIVLLGWLIVIIFI